GPAPHVEGAVNGEGRAVGVRRRKNEVAVERGLDADFGGLEAADLATMMTSGSWRRKARSAAAKLRPISSCICTWLMPTRLNSIGSSAVEMLVLTLFSSASAE